MSNKKMERRHSIRHNVIFKTKWHHSMIITTAVIMTILSPCHGFINPRSTIRLQRHHPPTITNPLPPSHHSPPSLSLLPIIKPSNTWGNIAILTTTASLSQTLAKTNPLSRLLGAPVTAMALSFLLASIGILPPGGSLASRQLQSISLNLATPLVLLGAELGSSDEAQRRRQRRRGKTPTNNTRRTNNNNNNNNTNLLLSFIVASIGTLLAGITATLLLPSIRHCCCSHSPAAAADDDRLKIAAALVAKNIGGGINYMAVCDTLRATPEAIAAGLCVDNIMALIYFPVVSVLGSGLPDVEGGEEEEEEEEVVEMREDVTVETLSGALALGSLLTYGGIQLGGKYSASLPASTLLTLLLVILSPRLLPRCCDSIIKTLRPTARILGTTLLYIFFSTAGAPGGAMAPTVREAFVPLGLFLSMLYVGHGMVLWGWRCWGVWMMKRRRRRRRRQQGEDDGKEMMEEEEGAFAKQRLLVASSAAIGGPATATALAEVNGWKRLIVPSLIVGNVGYAVATFIGVGFYTVFRTRL